MDYAPPGIALTQRMYELRRRGYTMPKIALQLSAEGYTLTGSGRHGSGTVPAPGAPHSRETQSSEQ